MVILAQLVNFEGIFEAMWVGVQALWQEIYDFMYCFFESVYAPTLRTVVDTCMPDFGFDGLAGSTNLSSFLGHANQWIPLQRIVDDLPSLACFATAFIVYKMIIKHVPTIG